LKGRTVLPLGLEALAQLPQFTWRKFFSAEASVGSISPFWRGVKDIGV
jgi:hypothetical protein